MAAKIDYYKRNPLTYADRRLGRSKSEWARSFACEDLRPLIVCRGPIRKEALDVFAQMGITHCGILLSEKDSIVYPNALAPELRELDPARVHRIPDYTGGTREERAERIRQIIYIAQQFDYDSVFAGYGFMAEDETFVRAIEEAGLTFIGPCSGTVKAAGLKDEAKRTAQREKVSTTPGVNNAAARTLLAKHKGLAGLKQVAREEKLDVDSKIFEDSRLSLEDVAEHVLSASYRKGIDLFSVDELAEQIRKEVKALFLEYPGYRVRLKAIGGGGGKGQRIITGPAKEGGGSLEKRAEEAAAEAPEKAREVLSEVKATGVGDNKNMLLELNIEQTRHHEIQLIGNGQWCVSLGGRDCSLQMHEQKLLEVSVTQEGLKRAIASEKESDRKAQSEALEKDLQILKRMETEAERFGAAVGLDSASTFECIVDLERHYFMEVNTRIQVEHRVSELCYALRFRNPDNPDDYFDVKSLVECMALLARHKERLPRPERVQREPAAVEARLNATDRSLQPHAGGTIRSWSNPLPYEVRDDQGICIKHPDTGLFMRYKVAGAYDSNIALLLTAGEDRDHSYERLHEILRQTTIRGTDLATNLEFHYGLVNWFRHRDVHAKATTRFVVPYLTQVGLLKEEVNELDLDFAYNSLTRHYEQCIKEHAGEETIGQALKANRDVLARKQTLVTRALHELFKEPHYLSAWLSVHHRDYEIRDGVVHWLRNPVEVLAATYELLHMEWRSDAPPAHVIWRPDHELLTKALRFYRTLSDELSLHEFRELNERLQQDAVPSPFDAAEWERIRASHMGFQRGLEILALLPMVGEKVGFFDLRVEADLSVHIPERLMDPQLQERMRKVLVPPPATRADEIVAVSGGMFYSREAPHLPPMIEEGDHFDEGQPLYVVEVMKMFNKVRAPFSGRIDKVLVDGADGAIIKKGQPLFKVTPDVKISDEDEKERADRRRANTRAYLDRIFQEA